MFCSIIQRRRSHLKSRNLLRTTMRVSFAVPRAYQVLGWFGGRGVGVLCRINPAEQDLLLGLQLCPSVHPAEYLTRVPWLLLLLISLSIFVLMLATLVQGQSGQGWGSGAGMWNPFRLFCLFVAFCIFFYFVCYFIFALVKQEL